MGTTGDRNFIAMDSARRSAESRATREIDQAFMAGVAACRAALTAEFGTDAGFTGRLMRIIDSVESTPIMSRTISVRPNPPIIPVPGEANG